jgi:hypothetical protein
MAKMDKDTINNIVRTAVKEAVDHVDSDIVPARLKAQKYFNGETDLGYETGRSGVVSTKVRDKVRSARPPLMRVFMSTGRYVEYTPNSEQSIGFAEEATEYIHQKMEQKGGFRILANAFDDAMIKKNGFVKVYYEEYPEQKIKKFQGLTSDQRTAIMASDEIEIVEEEETENGWDIKISVTRDGGDICVENMPPEEFFIDENARSIEDFYCCGHRTDMRVGDLVGMGYDADLIYNMTGTVEMEDTDGGEDDERRGYSADGEEITTDESMRRLMVTEAYMRMDIDGTGVPVLHRFMLGGTGYDLIDYEPVDEVPFAVFQIEPVPHSFWGTSIPDLIMGDQDASTSMLRGMLDNIALVNDPRTEVLEGMVDLDDLMNNEIGAIVRVQQQGAVTPLVTPFVAGQTLPAMQYYDLTIDEKTGITQAASGMDPDALQSVAASAANATVQAAAGQVEVMARNLAEGGVSRMFRLMLKLAVEHADKAHPMKMNGTFVDVDPNKWDDSMGVSVNVGLGTGREEEKMMMLNQLLAHQRSVYEGYGPNNGIVSLEQITNTMTDMIAMVGMRNPSRYFRQVTPEVEQQLAQQRAMQAQQQQPGDPTQGLIAAEQVKGQATVQGKMIDAQVKSQQMMMEDDRKRDEMAQDFALELAKITGQPVNTAAVAAEQNKDRYQ